MGLRADIFRNDYRSDYCRLDGVETVTIVNAEGPFDPTEDAPPVLIQQGPNDTINAVPATMDTPGEWSPAEGLFAAGGAFIASSDSRFGRLCSELLGVRFYGAVSLHDYDLAAEQAATGSARI